MIFRGGILAWNNPCATHFVTASANYRIDSDIPSVAALTVTAPGVHLRDFAILTRPAFCLAIVLRVFISSFDHNTRLLVFLRISTPPLKRAFYVPT
jgi:hypothetical protein